jgi:hypothetical protein
LKQSSQRRNVANLFRMHHGWRVKPLARLVT